MPTIAKLSVSGRNILAKIFKTNSNEKQWRRNPNFKQFQSSKYDTKLANRKNVIILKVCQNEFLKISVPHLLLFRASCSCERDYSKDKPPPRKKKYPGQTERSKAGLGLNVYQQAHECSRFSTWPFIIALRIACGTVAGDIIQDLHPRTWGVQSRNIIKLLKQSLALLAYLV